MANDRKRTANDARLEWDLCCESAEGLIGRGAFDDRALMEHVADCPHCCRELSAARWSRERIGVLHEPGSTAHRIDPLFVPAVLSRVRAERSPMRRRETRRYQRVLAGTALTTVLTVALVVGLFEAASTPGAGVHDPNTPWSVVRSESLNVLADRFLLGQADEYIPCEWIPSGDANLHGEQQEVKF